MNNIVNLKTVKFPTAIIVEKASQEDATTITYQLRQVVSLEYTKGNKEPKFDGGLNFFEEEDKQTEYYDSIRVAWQSVPKRKFPTIASFQTFISSQTDYFIQEIYGLNPIGMNEGYNYAIEKGQITLDKVISNNLKMQGDKDNLTPTFVDYKGQRVPLYSMKQLATAKAFGGEKVDADNCIKSLHNGKYEPLLIDVEEEEIDAAQIIGASAFDM